MKTSRSGEAVQQLSVRLRIRGVPVEVGRSGEAPKKYSYNGCPEKTMESWVRMSGKAGFDGISMMRLFQESESGPKPMAAGIGDPRCVSAFFDRNGGVGTGVFASANVSHGVGDDAAVVAKNRELVRRSLQLDRLVSARQVHGDQVYRFTGDLTVDEEIDKVDALITDRPGVGLMIQQADCQAVLLFDPLRPAVAAIHCGWRGSVVGIIGKTVEAMVRCFGTDPANLQAAVSPSLGPCCGEFVNYQTELPQAFHRFQVWENHFDFWRITRWQLQECGVKGENVAVAGVCTVCSPDYFSYRQACRMAAGITGRNCSVIGLRPIGGSEEVRHASAAG